MKSVFTLSFLITLFLTASTALAYDCYEQTPPPQVQSCGCSPCQKKQCQKPQCTYECKYECKYEQGYSCSTCNKCKKYKKYKKCNRCNCTKKAAPQKKYQCQTTYTQKTKRVATTQCKLCGTRYSKGVKHYCKKKQCRTCNKRYTRGTTHRCNKNKVQRTTCSTQYRQQVPYNCGEVRYKSCEVRYYPTRTRTRVPQQDCSQQKVYQYEGGSKRVATRCDLNLTRQENRETMETRWNAWVSRNQ